MNGDQVRDTWFYLPPGPVLGYDPRQVDDLLRRVAAELDAGCSARPAVENATLGLQPGGYDIDAVDWFLGQFLLPADHLELAGISDGPWGDLLVAQLAPGGVSGGVSRWNFFRQCEQAWRDFGQLPGTRLWFGKAARGLTELRTPEQQTLAFLRGSWRDTVSAGGRSFTYEELAVREAEPAGETWSNQTVIRSWYPLNDETGIPALYVSPFNTYWSARACIKFPDQRQLRFLVRGTQKANAIMTAVDQARNAVARYRLEPQRLFSRPRVEMIVHPSWKLTNELVLALVISAGWLEQYFFDSDPYGL